VEAGSSRGAEIVTLLEAPAGAIDRMRRPLRLGHVLVSLENLLILTWPLPAGQLRARLPRPLEPVVRADGTGLVSAVLFRNRALRPALVGTPRLSSFQMNVRSYVVDPATGTPTNVFFHGLYISRRWLARVSSALFGVPFQYLPFDVSLRRDTGHSLEWQAASPNGEVAVRALEAEGCFDAATLDLLTNPHTAWFQDKRGTVKRWSIWHRPQRVHTFVVERCAISCLSQYDLGEPETALFVPSVDYEVYLPPRQA
jgi:uncharacterized protein YqjF (DUF2071 family)